MACSMLSDTSMYVAKPDDAVMAAASEIQVPFHRQLQPRYASGRHQRASRAVRNAKIEIFEDSIGNDEILECGQQGESDIGTTFAKTGLKITSKITYSAAARTSQESEALTKRQFAGRTGPSKRALETDRRVSTSVNTSSLTQHSTTAKHYNLYSISRPSQLISSTIKPLQEVYKSSNNVLAQDWFGLDTGKENVPPGLHSPKLSSKSVFGRDNSSQQSRAISPVSNVSIPVVSVVKSLQYTAAPATEIKTKPISKAGAINRTKFVSGVGKVIASSDLAIDQQSFGKTLESEYRIKVQNWLLTEEQVVARLACHDLLTQQQRSYRLTLFNSLAKQLAIIFHGTSLRTKHSHEVMLRLAQQARSLLTWTETQWTRDNHKHDHKTWLNSYCLELLMGIFETALNSHLTIVTLETGFEHDTN